MGQGIVVGYCEHGNTHLFLHKRLKIFLTS